MTAPFGSVTLIGAGPGDPELITVKGLRALRRADVVIHDRLVAVELLARARVDAHIIDAGKSPGDHKVEQEAINTLIVEHARRGMRVVRLKGGDPFVFGRGSEEVAACRQAGIPCRVIPGVTSAIAGPAAAGIPVTERRHARTVAFVTGRTAQDLTDEVEKARYRAIAHADTVVILMSRGSLAESARAIMAAGRDPQTPAAAIQSATTPQQRVVKATLGTLAETVDRSGLTAPLITVIGEVAALAYAEQPAARPLLGLNVVVTRPRESSANLERRLRRAGATVIPCPLIRIEYPKSNESLQSALRSAHSYDWLVLTSRHAVRALGKQMLQLSLDARIFGRTRIAVVGGATATALACLGLRADFTPTVFTGATLASELAQAEPLADQHMLHLRSDLADSVMANRLRALGAVVDEVIAYHTVPCEPPAWAKARLESGVDAIVFCSPSAVRQFAALQLPRGNAKIACLGPTTADAARQLGWNPDIVPAAHDSRGLTVALTSYFSPETGAP